MHSNILVHLRYGRHHEWSYWTPGLISICSQDMRTIAAQQTDAFSKLDGSQQKLLEKISQGNTCVKDLITAMNDKTKGHVTQVPATMRLHIDGKIDYLVNRQTKFDQFDNLLKSLHFPKIDLRQGTIEDAHRKTYGSLTKVCAQRGQGVVSLTGPR